MRIMKDQIIRPDGNAIAMIDSAGRDPFSIEECAAIRLEIAYVRNTVDQFNDAMATADVIVSQDDFIMRPPTDGDGLIAEVDP